MIGKKGSGAGGADLSAVRFVKRIRVGASAAGQAVDDSGSDRQMELLNRCLNSFPRGHIVSIEQSVTILNVGGHPVPVQNIIYHVGFERKPSWLDDQGDAVFSGAAPPPGGAAPGGIQPDPEKVAEILKQVAGSQPATAPTKKPPAKKPPPPGDNQPVIDLEIESERPDDDRDDDPPSNT